MSVMIVVMIIKKVLTTVVIIQCKNIVMIIKDKNISDDHSVLEHNDDR